MSLLFISAALFFVGLMVAAFAVKLLLWLVLLPFRILFKVVFGVGWLILGAIAAPLLLLLVGAAVLVAVIGALLAILLPLLPVVLLAALAWAIYRGTRRPTTPIVES